MCAKTKKQAWFELDYLLTVNNAVMNFTNLLGTNPQSKIFLYNNAQKRTIITKIECFVNALGRGANNVGSLAGQVNAYQVEFEFVDVSNQLLFQSTGVFQDSTLVPFAVPVIRPIPVFRSVLNQTKPFQEYGVEAFGIAITRLSCQIQNTIVPSVNCVFNFGITYEEIG